MDLIHPPKLCSSLVYGFGSGEAGVQSEVRPELLVRVPSLPGPLGELCAAAGTRGGTAW